MKRFMAASALFALAAIGLPGQTKLKLITGGLTGSADVTITIKADGSKEYRFVSHLKDSSGTAEMIDVQTWAKSGRPLSHTVKTSTSSKLQQTIVVSYGVKDVTIKVTAGGKTRTTTSAIPKGTLEAKSEFWFLTTKPAKGAVDQFNRFSTSDMAWEKVKVVYTGPATVKINGKNFAGHLITDNSGKWYLDGKGDVLKLVWPGAELVRI
jgi:hypothetical protein